MNTRQRIAILVWFGIFFVGCIAVLVWRLPRFWLAPVAIGSLILGNVTYHAFGSGKIHDDDNDTSGWGRPD